MSIVRGFLPELVKYPGKPLMFFAYEGSSQCYSHGATILPHCQFEIINEQQVLISATVIITYQESVQIKLNKSTAYMF